MADALPLLAAALLGALCAAGLVIAGRGGRSVRSRLKALDLGQERLAGALSQVAQAQMAAQARTAEALGARLAANEARLAESLAESAARTAHSLGRLGARLDAVDLAQARMERVSSDIRGLSALLDNKQARGQLGEVQLMEILARALPPDAYTAQATLSNGRRVDVLIHGGPGGAIPIDAKFPLEPYRALLSAEGDRARRAARSAFKAALVGHIKAIAERYVLPGETAESALMFVPSEAVYAEAHARFAEVVRTGFEHRVWIVSPTTLMALLTTLSGVLREARMTQEAARIRRELSALARDVTLIGARAEGLSRHLRLAGADLDALNRAAERAGRRARRIEAVEFVETPRAAE
ncbi:MAG: DNA recombination protein RmuC [Pikeienuella sp.]